MTSVDRKETMGIHSRPINDSSQGEIGNGKELENAKNIISPEGAISPEYVARKWELKNAWLHSLISKNSW